MTLGEDFLTEPPPDLPEIAEGASVEESLAGALSLAASLVSTTRAQNPSRPAAIYIDAGTGMSAAALVLGLAYLKENIPVKVVWLGDRQGDFAGALERWRPVAESLLGPLPHLPPWTVLFPPTARSFGTVNQTVIEEVVRMARTEGILVDPVYTAKLMLTARAQLEPNSLLFCGGGAFELAGFQETLAKL